MEDRIRFIPETCSCGNPFPLIEPPVGRPENDFVYPGKILIHHLIFVTPILTEGHVVEFQVSQTLQGAQIRIVSNGLVNKQKIIDTIRQDYSRLGFENALIEIIDVPKIEYPHSGKLRRFIGLKHKGP